MLTRLNAPHGPLPLYSDAAIRLSTDMMMDRVMSGRTKSKLMWLVSYWSVRHVPRQRAYFVNTASACAKVDSLRHTSSKIQH